MPKGTGWCHHGCHRSCVFETHLHVLVYHTWATSLWHRGKQRPANTGPMVPSA